MSEPSQDPMLTDSTDAPPDDSTDAPQDDSTEGLPARNTADAVDDANSDGADGVDGVDDSEPGSDVRPTSSPGDSGAAAPETGDLVIDAALRDLAEAPPDDLDAQVERGEQVQRTLQGRLSDLGG